MTVIAVGAAPAAPTKPREVEGFGPSGRALHHSLAICVRPKSSADHAPPSNIFLAVRCGSPTNFHVQVE
jgi:hypothetical protein